MKKLIAIVLALVLALAVAACAPKNEAPVNESFTENLQFAKDGKTAYCPVCKKAVEWTAYEGANDSAKNALKDVEHAHLYLTKDLTYTKSALVSNVPTCLHLNGFNITADGGATAIDAYKTMNIMGTGVVTGNGGLAFGSAISTGILYPADLNIYGGTFKKNASNKDAPVIMVGTKGGKVNIYGGVIDATGTITEMFTSALHLLGSEDSPIDFTMNDGEIRGGTSGMKDLPGSGGAVYVGYAKFSMNGGTISGGNALDGNGGNIFFSANATDVLVNGTVTAGTALNGGNIYAKGINVEIGKNAVISKGVSDKAGSGYGGGNIWFGEGTLTSSGVITEGKCVNGNGAGGNIFFDKGEVTFIMNGGEISKGELPETHDQNYGCNIRAYNLKRIEINDGLIYGGKGGHTADKRAQGRNLYCGAGSGVTPELVINGGTIVGDIGITAGVKVTLSGKPNIVASYKLADGTEVKATYGGLNFPVAGTTDISGLQTDAKICVSGAAGTAISAANDKAETLLPCFSAYAADQKIQVVGKILQIAAK